MFQGKSLLILVLGILLGAIVAGSMFYLGQKSQAPVDEFGTFTPTPSTFDTNQEGIIEGSFSYPSEGIPEEMMACAERLSGQEVACTSEHISDTKFTYGVGYRLEVPPGTYFVYAQLPGSLDDYKAYYNEFVECGLSVDCESHEPIEVSVAAGETVTGIDPHDWYNR